MNPNSSNPQYQHFERSLPVSIGRKQLLGVTGLLLILIGVMEIKARKDDFRVNYLPPTPELWISQWLELDELPSDQLVVLGASRMQFGIIVPEWEAHTGVKPQILAWPGSPPDPVLSELAKRESFNGIVLCGFAPPFSFCHQDSLTTQRMKNNFKALKVAKYSLSHHLTLQLRDFLLPRVKCLNSMAYSPILTTFSNWPIENRSGLLHSPIFPFGGSIDRELNFRFRDNIEEKIHARLIDDIQDGSRRVLEHFGPADMDLLVEQYKRDVATIESRGGRVVFIRPPSDDKYYAFELEHYPREKFFDRIVKETGCLGIHFKDYPELDFPCVEDSHLGVENALDYTRGVIEILKQNRILDRHEP